MSYAALPHALITRAQWLVWRLLPKHGALTKVPIDPITDYEIDANDPKYWLPFDKALSEAQAIRADGIGIAARNGLILIDLDDCLDPQGVPSPQAQALIEHFKSYTEISPSGTGLRIIVHGSLPNITRRDFSPELHGIAGSVFANSGYCTITGEHFKGTPQHIADHNGSLSTWYAETFAEAPEQAPIATYDTKLAAKLAYQQLQVKLGLDYGFKKIWAGDAKYASNSEAVLGLRTDLLRLTLGDPDLAEGLFRQSPLYQVNPKKWDRIAQYDYPKALAKLAILPAPQQAAKESGLTVLSEDQANALKPPDWLIDGVVVRGQITVISGKKGSFKTFEAIHQTLKIAQICPTMYIAAEDPIGVATRRRAWRAHYQCDEGVMLMIPQAVKFHDPQQVTELLSIIRANDIGHVTIDTIAACYRGLNENNPDDMGKVIEGIERVRDQGHVSIMAIAHESSKNANGIRGWSGIGDASYIEISAQRVERSNVVTLKGVRFKQTLEQDHTHTLIESDGTLVVTEVPVGPLVYPERPPIELSPREYAILALIAQSGANGLMKRDILKALKEQYTIASLTVALTLLKKEHAYITQDRQGAPYLITLSGLTWFLAQDQNRDNHES